MLKSNPNFATFRIWNALSIGSYFKCFCSSPGKEQAGRLGPGCMRILRDDGLLNKPRICFLVHCAGRRLLLLPRTGLPCHAFSTAVRLKSLKTMSRDELLLHQIVSMGNLGPSSVEITMYSGNLLSSETESHLRSVWGY